MINASNVAIWFVGGVLAGSVLWFFGWQLLYGLILLIMYVLYIVATPLYWFCEFLHLLIIKLRKPLAVIERKIE